MGQSESSVQTGDRPSQDQSHCPKLIDWEIYLADPLGFYKDQAASAVQNPLGSIEGAIRGQNRVMAGIVGTSTQHMMLVPRSIYRAANQSSLSDLGDVPKMCAHVAAQCYNIPEPLPIGTGESRRIGKISGTVSSGNFALEEDTHFKNRYFAVYFEHQRKLAILGYTGTRFGTEFFMRDVATDVNVLYAQSSDPYFVDVLRTVSGRLSGRRGYTLLLTGHSLGGTRALVSSHHPFANDTVGAVHVFNAGAGLGADTRQQRLLDEAWQDPNILKAYGRGLAYTVTEAVGSVVEAAGQGIAMLQGAGGQPECTRTCHHIFGDPISMLNVSSSHMEVITYQVHADAPDRHSMQNFTAP